MEMLGRLAAAFVLLGLTLPANAALINGELSLDGTNNTDLTAQTITFTSANPPSALGETGDFTVLGTGGTTTFRNTGSPIALTSAGFTTGSNLSCGVGCVFTASNNGATATLDLLTAMISEPAGGFLDITGTGTLTLTGFQATPGTFSLSTQGGTAINLTFSSTASAVPGPVVGAGLPGLLAGLTGLWGLARRRRKLAA